MKQYFVKDGSRNCFIAEANLKDGSSIFSNGKKNEKNTENAAEERGEMQLIALTPMTSSKARAPEMRMITRAPTEMIKHHSEREQTLVHALREDQPPRIV